MKKQRKSPEQKSPDLGELGDKFIAEADNIHTQRARKSDLREFVLEMSKSTPKKESLTSDQVVSLAQPVCTDSDAFLALFLTMEQPEAMELLKAYRSRLIAEQFREATINRRLMTLRGFIRFARERRLTLIKVEKSIGAFYPPLRIVSLQERECHNLVRAPGARHLRDLRDSALLSLLCEVPLHSGQVGAISAVDYLPRQKKLRVPRESPTEEDLWVSLEPPTCDRLGRYLKRARHQHQHETPLFRNLDRRPEGGTQLTSKSVLKIVQDRGAFIGYMHLTPRILRCTAILRALKRARGNIAQAKQWYPHIGQGTWEYYRQHYPQ